MLVYYTSVKLEISIIEELGHLWNIKVIKSIAKYLTTSLPNRKVEKKTKFVWKCNFSLNKSIELIGSVILRFWFVNRDLDLEWWFLELIVFLLSRFFSLVTPLSGKIDWVQLRGLLNFAFSFICTWCDHAGRILRKCKNRLFID